MRCIILSGATVPFSSSIQQISPELVSTLKNTGYNHIEVQYGHAKSDFTPIQGVQSFDFDPNIKERISKSDLVITHAGAGSLLDSLERGIGPSNRKIIVVINAALMNNHQTELAYKSKQSGCVMVVESPYQSNDAIVASSQRNFSRFEQPGTIAPIIESLIS